MTKDYLPKSLIALYCVLLLCVPHVTGQRTSASSSKIIEALVGLENEWLATYVSGDKTKYDRNQTNWQSFTSQWAKRTKRLTH